MIAIGSDHGGFALKAEIISLDLGEALEEYLDQAPTRMRG